MKINEIAVLESKQYNLAVNEAHQLDEIDWKSIQKKVGQFTKGAQKFTKNLSQTGDAVAGAANAIGGAGKELGKQLVARPVGATYNAVKGGLGKATDVAKGVYGDVKKGVQAVGKGVSTTQQDAGDVAKFAGNTAAKAVGGTVGAAGSVAGAATTGVARAAAKGFNQGVKATGGNAVNKMQSNIMQQPKATAAEPEALKTTGSPKTSVSSASSAPSTSGAVPVSQQQMNAALNSMTLTQLVNVQDNVNRILSKKFPRYKAAA